MMQKYDIFPNGQGWANYKVYYGILCDDTMHATERASQKDYVRRRVQDIPYRKWHCY